MRRGQKAIPIIEPVKEYVRDDGSIGVLYDVRKVFDVSQTPRGHAARAEWTLTPRSRRWSLARRRE